MDDKIILLCYNVLAILIPALCAILIELARRKLGSEKIRKIQAEMQTKQELACLAVKMAEQAFKDLHGEEKFNQAAKWLTERAVENGITITVDEIKGLIEAAVRMTKDEFGEQWAKQ